MHVAAVLRYNGKRGGGRSKSPQKVGSSMYPEKETASTGRELLVHARKIQQGMATVLNEANLLQ